MTSILFALFLCTSIRTDAAPAYPATAFTLHARDFDGDGHLDLITGGTPGAAILYGRGDGTFEEPIALVEPFGYAHVADTNGDGRLDVIVAPSRWNGVDSISIVENAGGRTWSAPRTLALPRDTFLGAGDFTNDGRADLLTYDGNGPVSVLRVLVANADGSYTTLERRAFVQTGGEDRIADVDGDGNLDFLSIIDQRYGLMRGLGNGLFTAREPIGPGEAWTRATALADFTGDGRIDLSVAQDQYPTARLVVFDGPVASARTTGRDLPFASGKAAYRSVPGDFDGDSITDLALLMSDSRLSIYKNDGRGNFSLHSQALLPMDRGDLVAGDFNEDGALDLAAGTPAAAVFLNKGDGTFRGSRVLRSGAAAPNMSLQIMAADVNGDGIDELVQTSAGRVSVGWLDNGQYSFRPLPITYGQFEYAEISMMSARDLDAVPGAELVVAVANRLMQFTWRNGEAQLVSSATLSKRIIETAIAGGRVITVEEDGRNNAGLTGLKTPLQLLAADVDGDGIEDLLNVHAGRDISDIWYMGPPEFRDGHIELMRGRADGTFAAAERVFSGFGIRDAATGDFNADGRIDLAAGTDDGGIFQLLNDGNGAFTPHVIDATKFALLDARDVNGDGITDLAANAQRVIFFQGASHDGLSRAGSFMAGTGVTIVQTRHDAPPVIVTVHQTTNELLSIEFECAPRRRGVRK